MKTGAKSVGSKAKEEVFILQNQLQNLLSETSRKDAEINNLKLELNSKNNIIIQKNNEINTVIGKQSNLFNQKAIEISSKDQEIKGLQSEISVYKNSLLSAQKELKQKDNIIELISRSVDDLRLEKQELKEDNKVLKNLASFYEEKLKEKELQLSLFHKSINGLDESHIDIDQILDPFKGNQTIQSEYIEKSESKLGGDNSSFIMMENNDDNI
jgi:chromosome segregation ATPase